MNRGRVIVLVEEEEDQTETSMDFNCGISMRRILQIVKYIAIFIFIASAMVTIFKVWNKSSSIDIVVVVEEKASERADIQGETTTERPTEITTQRLNSFPNVKSNDIEC